MGRKGKGEGNEGKDRKGKGRRKRRGKVASWLLGREWTPLVNCNT